MLTDEELIELYAHPAPDRAWVRTNFVQSLDGAAQDTSGVSGKLGGSPDAAAFRVMRSLADVILVGAGTARAEGYAPVLASEILPGSTPAPIAVVSRSLDIPDALVAPGQLVITTATSDADRRAELAETLDVIVAGESAIDWIAVLEMLAARGLQRVLCEGGPHLHGTLLDLDLVDELCVTIAPTALAGPALRIATSQSAQSRALDLEHAVSDDGVLLTRWTRHREGAREG